MKINNFTRRKFLISTSTGTVGALLLNKAPVFGISNSAFVSDLAIKGGKPVRSVGWMDWPVWDSDAENPMLSVLRSGKWYRDWGTKVSEFEKQYADLIGAKRALATASGTTALETALHVMDVDAGDEVIVSPYTFIATYNVVFNQQALPVFADTDQETLRSILIKLKRK